MLSETLAAAGTRAHFSDDVVRVKEGRMLGAMGGLPLGSGGSFGRGLL